MDKEQQGPQSDSGEVETIAQPASLRDKVGIVPDGVPDPVEMADRAIEEQGKTYLERARDELAALRDAFDSGMDNPAGRADALCRMFTAAHDMKGQGRSFGYDMITSIASSLCVLLRDRTEMEDAGMKVVKVHVDALGVVFDHDLKGDGGEQGRMLLDRLSGLVTTHAD